MQPSTSVHPHVVALAGGVGGAKMAAGLQAALPPGHLTVIVNTGDDFEHWGLTICPDLDTVLYHLADVCNHETGWGRRSESHSVLEEISRIGGEEWFRLGDRDLALHLRRSEWLRQGISLTDVTDRLRRAMAVPTAIIPMSDTPVRTLVHTDEGDLPFQHYFVRRRCEPLVIDLTFVGAPNARLPERAQRALQQADVVVLCPSNPYLSIDPILSIPGLRKYLRQLPVPRIAISPIVGGKAIKGPAAKMMRELGQDVSPLTVARHLDAVLTGFVLDEIDRADADDCDLPVLVTNTLMSDMASKERLANDILVFAAELLAGQRRASADLPSF